MRKIPSIISVHIFFGYLGFELDIMTMDNIKGQKEESKVLLLGTSH